MRKIFFVALSVFILSSCVNKVDTTKENNPIDATENNANIEQEDYESHDIPLYYYNMLNENLGDMNIAIKNDGLEPQKFYDEMMKDFPEI